MDIRDLMQLAGLVNPELLNKLQPSEPDCGCGVEEEADSAGFEDATTRPEEEVFDDPMQSMGSDVDTSLRRYLKAKGDHVTVDEDVYPDFTVEDVTAAYAAYKEPVVEGRMKDQVIDDSETMSKAEFAKKHGKKMADEYYESVNEAACGCCGNSPCDCPADCSCKKNESVKEAVGEFAEPYFDLIDRVGGDAKLVNREALAWLGGNARDEITGGDDNYEDYMSHDDLVNEITRYMSGDEIKEFVAHFEQHYDLNNDEEMEEAAGHGKKNNDAEIWADAVEALHDMGGDLEDSETYDWYAVAQAIAKKHGGWDEDKYEPTDEFVDKIMNLANKHVSANESVTYLKKLAGL